MKMTLFFFTCSRFEISGKKKLLVIFFPKNLPEDRCYNSFISDEMDIGRVRCPQLPFFIWAHHILPYLRLERRMVLAHASKMMNEAVSLSVKQYRILAATSADFPPNNVIERFSPTLNNLWITLRNPSPPVTLNFAILKNLANLTLDTVEFDVNMLYELTNLKKVCIGNTKSIVTLSPRLLQLPSLTHLYLCNCSLQSVPLEPVVSTTLQYVKLCNVGLVAFPTFLCEIKSLRYLNLIFNNKKSFNVLPEIAKLQSLETLIVDEMDREVPELYELKKLTVLALGKIGDWIPREPCTFKLINGLMPMYSYFDNSADHPDLFGVSLYKFGDV